MKVIAIENNSVVKSDNYQTCNHAEDLVLGGLYEAAGKAKLMVADVRSGDEPTPANNNAKAPATLELKVTVEQMGTYQELLPGYWTERWQDNCEISLTYSVVDPASGTVIVKSTDNLAALKRMMLMVW